MRGSARGVRRNPYSYRNRGGYGEIRIPTVTGSRGWVTARGHPAENRLDKPRFRDPQLKAVRTATERFLPGFSNLKVRRSPLRMVVEKHREELLVNQLSDGEKCTLAMVGDLARRLAVANPHMTNPLAGEAIVLIDEADLHLHPAWQRHLVGALEETFPNCQFFLSTHSPALLSHVKSTGIWLLARSDCGIDAQRPSDSYGQAVDRVT